MKLKIKLIQKVHSLSDLWKRANSDPRYAELTMCAAANLGGEPYDLKSARQTLFDNATAEPPFTSEQGVVDEVNFCRNLVGSPTSQHFRDMLVKSGYNIGKIWHVGE